MNKINCSPEYLAKVASLSEEEAERLLSRMTGKLPRRFEKNKLSREEALAMQMELEDDLLNEWRVVMAEMKCKEEARALKAAEKLKPVKSEVKKSAKEKAPKSTD